VISGVEADMKDSHFMPRFLSYQDVVLGIEETVRTRWSREVIFAAGVDVGVDVDAILINL
jgi:hypothetical protein